MNSRKPGKRNEKAAGHGYPRAAGRRDSRPFSDRAGSAQGDVAEGVGERGGRPPPAASGKMNQAPYGYEHRDLPEVNRRAWKRAGAGMLLTVSSVIAWFALSERMGPILRTLLAALALVVGQSIFWKHFRGSSHCPRCGTRFGNTVQEDYRTILFVCEKCRICWDTGVIHEPSSGISS